MDMTDAMAERARQGARTAGLANVDVRIGDAMALPVACESVDVVMSNGVLNVTSDKRQAFGELRRVLKPGGAFLYGDIIVAGELPASVRRNVDFVDGLNRRRSAGGRACRRPHGDRVLRGDDHAPL
jgi:arsenite methyltransferase